MKRITEKNLAAICARINRTLGTPQEAYSKQADGTYAPNAHAYLIDYAYGGASLQQMLPTGTGQRTIFGYSTKRELAERMYDFLAGIDSAREAKS